MVMVSSSLWSADLGRLADAVDQVKAVTDAFHFDIMDGRFVPNFLFGPDIIRTLRDRTDKPFETHLMIEQPERFLEVFRDAGTDVLIVHPETCQDLPATLQAIRHLGMQPGVALNPDVPIAVVEPHLPSIDLVLILCVVPGFRQQEFIPSVLTKVRELKQRIRETGSPALIEADGAIRDHTVPMLVEAGVDMVTGGSIVFRQPDPRAAVAWLHSVVASSSTLFGPNLDLA
jgi:ribulose-phosphate 3-epimerase